MIISQWSFIHNALFYYFFVLYVNLIFLCLFTDLRNNNNKKQ